MYKQAGLWCGSPFESLSDGQWCVGRFPTQSNPYNLSLSLSPPTGAFCDPGDRPAHGLHDAGHHGPGEGGGAGVGQRREEK